MQSMPFGNTSPGNMSIEKWGDFSKSKGKTFNLEATDYLDESTVGITKLEAKLA